MTPVQRTWVKRLGIGFGVLAVLVAAALLALGYYVRSSVAADDIEALLNDVVADATDGLYTVTLDEIDWGATAVSPRLHGISLMLDRQVLARKDADGTLPKIIFQLQHATVDVSGVDPWSLIQGDGLRAYSLEIDQPLIQLSGLEAILGRGAGPGTEGDADPVAETEPVATEPAEPGSTPAEDVVAAAETVVSDALAAADLSLPERPVAAESDSVADDSADDSGPKVRIWRVRLNDAELESYRRQEADTSDIRDTFQLYESFAGVNIAIDDLDLADADAAPLFVDDLRIGIQEYYYLWPDGRHEERHGPINFMLADGLIRIENFRMTPLFEREDSLDEAGAAMTSRDVQIASASIEGLDFETLISNQGFHAVRVAMEGLRTDLVADPPGREDEERASAPALATAPLTEARPGALLTEMLSGLPSIVADELVIQNASIRYRVDRDTDGAWLDEPETYHAIENFNLRFDDYRSGPEVDFDPSRPLFAAAWDLSVGGLTTTVGAHRAQMSNWHSTSADSEIGLDSLTVVPLGDRRLSLEPGEEPANAYRVTTGEVALEAVNFGSLMDEVDVEIGRMIVAQPDVHATVADGPQDPDTDSDSGGPSPAELIGGIIVGLPDVQIDEVNLVDANYRVTVDRVDGEWLGDPIERMLIEGLDFNLNAVFHEVGDPYDADRPLLSESASAHIGRFVFAPGDGFDELEVIGIDMSSGRHDVTVQSIDYGPVTRDRDLLVRRVREKSLAAVTTGRITLVGATLARYLDSGMWELDRVEIQQPQIRLYETLRESEPEPAAAGEATPIADLIEGMTPIRVAEFVLREAVYERRQASPDYDWAEIPPPVSTVQNLNLTVQGFDSSFDRGLDRLLFSDHVLLTADELAMPLGASGTSLSLRDFELASDSSTLTIGGATISTRASDGDNDFHLGRIELDRVPYRRFFGALVSPRSAGTTPMIAAMVDKDLHLRIDGIDGQLDDGARTLTVGPIVGTAADGSLSVGPIALAAASTDADPSTPEIEVERDMVTARSGGIDLTGVDFDELGTTGVLSASELILRDPYVGIVSGMTADETEVSSSEAPTEPSVPLAQSIRDALAGFPTVRVDRVRAEGFTVQQLQTVGGQPAREFSDVDLAIDGLDLRPDRGPLDEEGLLYASDIRVNMPSQRIVLDNTVYELEFGPIALSTGRGTLDLGAFGYVPPYDAERFLERTAIREGDRIEVRAGSVGLSGIDMRGFLEHQTLNIAQVDLAEWSLEILSDKHKPRNPNPGIASYPHEAFQSMSMIFAVDEVRLRDGAVRYSERHREGTRVGTIWWDRLTGSIRNLSNDPERMTLDSPAVLSISARMFDEAFLNLEWRLPLLEPGPTMSYSGEMSPLNAPHLTQILEPLEGLRITEGVVDQAYFHVDITNSHATGEFTALYRDLGLQIVDRNDGGRNLGQRLLGFAAGLIMPHNNRDAVGEPARVGTIDWIPEPQDPFFKVFWGPVRDGILDLVMP